MTFPRPTKDQLEAARGGHVPDLIADDLDVLLCGINPSLWSVVVGHHFARPGNRFWTALADSGFTERVLRPDEEHLLLARGIGITNISLHATARADELPPSELHRGAQQLRVKLRTHEPRVLAVLGITAYRAVFDPAAQWGRQPNPIEGTTAWVLPNPSGLNAHFQRDDLARAFGQLREYLLHDRTGSGNDER